MITWSSSEESISRSIANGSIKRLGFDDYVMTATVVIYTGMLVLIQLAAHYETNLLDPAGYNRVLANPQEVKDRIFGSKVVVGVEQCMLLSTWGVKTCMLTLFWRLTKNLRLHIYVQIIAAYVAIGFVTIMITYYAVYCRPFSQYWAMPVQNMQCATYQHYSITQAVFNISSDAAMLAVPIPLLMKAQLRMRKKIVLFCIMSLGLFTVVAAILNKAFNFASPLTTIYQIWYIREASTAMYVANLVCLWPLLRRTFGFSAFQSSTRQYRQQETRPNKETSDASRSAATRLIGLQSKPPVSNFRGLPISRHESPEKNTGLADGPQKSNEESIEMCSTTIPNDSHEPREMPQEWEDDESRQRVEGQITPYDLETGQITVSK
ncbi:uncharacterized protein KD926_005206 [Aspergillus affinis]|uniref:uncharacterized protein n=1 Tax=Aspergillus affinis TaxID=1070780 RepID=UPI0022FDB840|nr:uncharacterized protein KD926_005206 [Aspergillus affinis]KAI9042600.1 hypothetical protein KD926_005206 [Aspergillus affinis]